MGMGNTAKRVFGGLGGAVLLSAALAVPAFAEEGVTTMATTAPLNLRAGAGMGYSVVDVVPENTSVQVFGMTRPTAPCTTAT